MKTTYPILFAFEHSHSEQFLNVRASITEDSMVSNTRHPDDFNNWHEIDRNVIIYKVYDERMNVIQSYDKSSIENQILEICNEKSFEEIRLLEI